MESTRKKLKITAAPRGIWELNICVACKNPLDSTSKILKCLHGMCNQCFESNSLVPVHFACKCGEKTDLSTGLINYSFTCERFDKNFRSNYTDQQYKKTVYEKYSTKARCPNCVNKCIELYCVTCSTFLCALCQLLIHRTHQFKTVDKIMEEVQSNLLKNKLDLSEKSNFLFNSKSSLESDINKLNKQKVDLIKKVQNQFDEIRTELFRSENQMINYVEKYYKGRLETTNEAISAIDELKEKYNFYQYFSGSVLKESNKADLDITNLVDRKLKNVNKGFKNEIMKLDTGSSNIDLKANFDDALKQLIESVKRITIQNPNKYKEAFYALGRTANVMMYPGYFDIIRRDSVCQLSIISDKAIKEIINYNCARQEKKRLKSANNESSISAKPESSNSANNESSISAKPESLNSTKNESSNSANNESSISAKPESSNSNTNPSSSIQARQ
ncbi:hypothetical protein QTP88_020407 [Uroleucon formosanum]